MKEIKAYIQRHLVNNAVAELERAGAPGITIIEIHPVGYGYEPNYFGFQTEDVFKRYATSASSRWRSSAPIRIGNGLPRSSRTRAAPAGRATAESS